VEVCSAIDANHLVEPGDGKLTVSPIVGVDEYSFISPTVLSVYPS
jgi:hypothetical protein